MYSEEILTINICSSILKRGRTPGTRTAEGTEPTPTTTTDYIKRELQWCDIRHLSSN
jgi:hypothetical protein